MAKPAVRYAFTDAVDTTERFNRDELLTRIEETLVEYLGQAGLRYVWDEQGRKYTIDVMAGVFEIVAP